MERALVIRAREGDAEAFSQLVASSIGRLTAIARLILRDEERARDAVQDAFLDAWRDIRGLRDPDRFEAWLYRLIVHACHTHARRERRRSVVEIHVALALTPDVAQDGVRPGALETHDQLERGLRRLTPDQRAVLVLTYYLDQPLAESARILDIPLGTMKSRLNRATQALRAALEAEEREPASRQERYA